MTPRGAGKTLVWIVGPPAVGKMTVGRALEALTGLPLLHNHMAIEPVLPFFEFGSPPFRRLVGEFRARLFEAVAESDLPGMIFTYVWAFDLPEDAEFVRRTVDTFASRGGRTVFVELRADLATRIERNATPLRLAEKPSKRDVAASESRLREMERLHRTASDADFPYPHHFAIDNSRLAPEEAARRIAGRFGLPARAGAP